MGWGRVLTAVARRPDLWVTAARQARALTPPGWWHRAPYLPRPAADYLRFRLATQYGDPTHRPEPADVVQYLAWCKAFREHT